MNNEQLIAAIRNGVPLEEPVSVAKAMMAREEAADDINRHTATINRLLGEIERTMKIVRGLEAQRMPSAATPAPVSAEPTDVGISGPLTEAQRDECRYLYNNLKHLQSSGYYVADDVIRKAAVYGYMNGCKDFSENIAPSAGAPVSGAEQALLPALKKAAKLLRAAGFTMTGTATSKIVAAINTAESCTVPPAGWQCTRVALHDGPCAAVPMADVQELPALPEPDHSLDNGAQPFFTADQMHDYARAALATAMRQQQGDIKTREATTEVWRQNGVPFRALGYLAAQPVPEAADQADSVGFDECCATGQSCQYGAHGREGEMQCKYCGKGQPTTETDATPYPVAYACPQTTASKLTDDHIYSFWLYRDCIDAIRAGDMKGQFVAAVRAVLIEYGWCVRSAIQPAAKDTQ